MDLAPALEATTQHLLSLRSAAGYWEGALASSALSTATAIVALHGVDAVGNERFIHAGREWLARYQNADGGWGDTTLSKSNLSTTLLCWSALGLTQGCERAQARAQGWITQQIGSIEPQDIARAVVGRYGKDKTFSVPILMLCAICGRLGSEPWGRVLPLPFELAALPRHWFGALGLPVVSYALPALIAIGYARFFHAPPAWWNPLRWLRALCWERVSPMLAALQPSTGGYLEATPLTSFVTMALASAGEKAHPCVGQAVAFLQQSMRAEGAWPIDTNLATWGTTLSIKALCAPGVSGLKAAEADALRSWLLRQQYQEVHPFTHAAPGGWAWTPLPGGVPDADDTAGALLALKLLGDAPDSAVQAGVQWLQGLQNRDGGTPTFCRGWGTLPFDRSTAELTSHALRASYAWGYGLNEQALYYLEKTRHEEGWWEPLWFGNEHTAGEINAVYGTAQVLIGLLEIGQVQRVRQSLSWLLGQQHVDGSWGGVGAETASVEETAVALEAVCRAWCSGLCQTPAMSAAIHSGVQALLLRTQQGTAFPVSPIGLYFARLWYHEQLYPVVWTLSALGWAGRCLRA